MGAVTWSRGALSLSFLGVRLEIWGSPLVELVTGRERSGVRKGMGRIMKHVIVLGS